MAEGLKVMALEGHGIAFLPQSAVRKEVRARTLVSALPPEIEKLEATMEIRAYRERPTASAPASPARVPPRARARRCAATRARRTRCGPTSSAPSPPLEQAASLCALHQSMTRRHADRRKGHLP